MKKTIALVSALAIVFCCSFPAFATTPTGRRREASYDYGDVSLHVSVDAGASVTYNNDVCHYDHRFTVTLTNKTNKFQVADQNILGFKLYTGRKDYFDNTFVGSSGTTQNNASWGAEVTSYSDNMTVPDIKFYTSASSGWEGSVYIKFNDSDLLVLNPNETRTYNFTIDFIASQTTGAMPINGNYVYGYFTYLSNSSISIFNKPNTFTSNTIEDFLNNDSFPNSIIPWLIASYEQGEIDQQKYDLIIEKLAFSNNPNISLNDHHLWINYIEQNISIGSLRAFLHRGVNSGYIVDRDIEISPALDDSYAHSDIYCIPVYYNFMFNNTLSNNLKGDYYYFRFTIPFPFTSSTGYLGCDFKYDLSNTHYFIKPFVSNSSGDITTNIFSYESDTDGIVFPVGISQYTLVVYYYFDVSGISNVDTTYTNIGNTNIGFSWANNYSVREVNYSVFSSIPRALGKIIELLTGNNSNNQEVVDSADSSSSTVEQQHQQESNIYDQTNQAIADTGIHNFQFDSQSLGGLGGVKNDFMAVWNALGSFSSIFITSLTIGLALSIIRHRRMFKS